MAVSSGPDIVDSGLVLALDAADINSFDKNENLALNSEAINSWGSNGNSISISANSQIAPDGTLTADVLSQTAVTGASRWTSSMTRTYTAGVTYTLSIWLKKISGTDAQPGINLWVEGGTSQSVGTITTEWVRYSKSFTPASTISSNTFTGLNIGWNDTGVANNFTFSAWGFQVETGSSASPYYPTTGTAKTRGSTLIDLIGNGNTGTLINGPTYNSVNGGSIVFDGVDDYVSIPKTSQFNFGTSDFTIETFCNLTSKTSQYPCIFSNYSAYGSGAIYFGFAHDSVSTKYTIWVNGQGSPTLTSSTNVIYGSWTQLTLVRSSGVGYFYINNSLDGTPASMSASLNGNGSFITIGRAIDGSSTSINGRISNFRIYNRALSSTEIQQNFNATRRRFGI